MEVGYFTPVRPRSGSPTRRAAVFLGTVGLAAAMCSPALADSGAADVPLPAVPDLAMAVVTVLEDETLQDVLPAEVVLPDLEPVAAAAPPTTLPAVPAQETAAEPATAGAVAAPPPEPVSQTPAAPEPDLPAPDAPSAAAVEQTTPTNVNVSVRVDSPGDNGSVEQVNAGEAASTTVDQYRPEELQYQPSIPVEPSPETAAAPDTPSTAEDWGWEWTWTWDCVDPVPMLPAVPSGGMENWIWNWDWDCAAPDLTGENSGSESPAQYQAGASQYRPININISIRINSPGNDGPVTQTNVAVASATTITFPTIRIEAPAAPVGAGITPAATVSVAGADPVATIADAFFGDLAEDTFEPAEILPLRRAQGTDYVAAERRSAPMAPTPDVRARDITAPARFEAAVEVTLRLAKASTAAAQKARAAAKPKRTVRPAPPRRPADAGGAPTLTLSSGFAPVSATDGRLGYLMLALVGIGFFAFANATRSVAAEVRAAGEDPDPPPDRPG